MSLVSFALRLVVSRMLKERTLARDLIFNSPVDPLVEWKARVGEGDSLPCIAVYTGKRSPNIVGKVTQGTDATIELIFDILVPPTPIVVDDYIELTTTNTGGAMVMDIVWRQIEAALRGAPAPWQDIWDIFVIKVLEIESRPLLYQIEAGNTVPCVEVTMRLLTVPDPDFGAPLLPGWQKLCAAMADDPDYRDYASFIEKLITDPADLSSWEQVQAALGLSRGAVDSIGLDPADSTAQDNPVLVAGVAFTDAERRP